MGASLATLPRFQTAVGEIEALLYANQRLIYSLADDIDRQVGLQAQTVKYLATKNTHRAGEIGLELKKPIASYQCRHYLFRTTLSNATNTAFICIHGI